MVIRKMLLGLVAMAMLVPCAAQAQNVPPPASTDLIILSRRDANGVGTPSAVPVASVFNLAGVGISTGGGGAVTQITARTTGVTLNTQAGAITLVSAAGSATASSFTVTNSTVAATDTIIVVQKSGTDLFETWVTAVAAGSFRITSFTTGGTTTEQPVFSFVVVHGANS